SDALFAAQQACQPPRKWSPQWPLGLDPLIEVFRYNTRQQILKFFLEVICDIDSDTLEQKLLFARGIDAIDPENIKAVLSDQFTGRDILVQVMKIDFNLGLLPPTFHPLLGSRIFTQDGAQWQHSRDLLRPQFLSNRFKNSEQISDAVNLLAAAIPNGKEVNLHPRFFHLTLQTTLFLLFGKRLPSTIFSDLVYRETEFAEALDIAQDYLPQRGRLGDLYWLMGGKRFRDACRICHEFVDSAVEKALLASHNKQSPSPADETNDPKVLRDQCINILLAGRHTTASCLTWALFLLYGGAANGAEYRRLLVFHPQVMAKLRNEIKETFGVGLQASEPVIGQLKQLPYLKACFVSTHLYPYLPVNSRAAAKTTAPPTGGGPDGKAPILVRKGEVVGYCVYPMHRQKTYFGEDADQFRPERWEDGALEDIAWAYLPFNGGPRVCLGQEFAPQEAKYTIVKLLQTFESIKMGHRGMSDVTVGQERQALTLVVSSGEGCRVKMARYVK
ncbi:n-alkane-inducible cytochrome P450, partial [Penicillium malachiteum]